MCLLDCCEVKEKEKEMSRFDSIDVFKDISDESANETEDEREQAKPIAEELKRDDEGPQPEKLLKKKRIRVDKPFDENMLTSGNGLERIYQEFPNIYKCGGRGSEAKSLKKLTAMYKEWAFQLHRGLAFQDVLSKCETLGSKGQVRSHLHRLRELERDRYIVSFWSLSVIIPCLLYVWSLRYIVQLWAYFTF